MLMEFNSYNTTQGDFTSNLINYESQINLMKKNVEDIVSCMTETSIILCHNLEFSINYWNKIYFKYLPSDIKFVRNGDYS